MKVRAIESTREPPELWVTLGGRIEDDEEVLEAARREFVEETGLTPLHVGPILWYGEQILDVDDEPTLFIESFVLVRCDARPLSRSDWSKEERASVLDIRWWTLEELAESGQLVKPPGLSQLLEPVIAGRLPKTTQQIAL